MSLHPSLSGVKKGKQHRSVLKRFERIAVLKKEGKWDDARSVFGLPKLKIIKIKIKIKKEKAAAPEAVQAEAQGVPSATGAEAAAKTQAANPAAPIPLTKPQPKAK